jgi:hypothetical protein
LTPNRTKGRRAGGEYKGAREALTRHARPHRPAAGWPGGGAKDQTDDPAELHVLF